MNTKLRISILFWVILTVMGCTLTNDRPIAESAVLDPPPPVVPVDQPLTITSTHRDPVGIQKVEFYVDDILINTSVPSFPQTYYIVDHVWSPPGEKKYTLRFVAYNNDDVQLEEKVLNVEAKSALVLVATGIAATPTRPTTPVPVLTPITSCGDSAILVQETVPAGTTVNPAQAFTKSWTIRNNGTCNWVGYYFDLVGGARLGGTRVSLPTVATNTDIPVTLNLVSPAEGGTHRGEWRVYNSQGQAFPQTFVVEINVPGSCANPVIDRFDATSLVIGPDQNTTLSWAVSGATTVTLEPGPQLPGTTGSITVSPDQTTTYTLRAVNGACSSTRQLTINVSNSPGAPAAPTTLDEDETRRTQTSVTLTWNDNSTNETQFRLYLVDTNALVATFPANATEGTLFNRTCNTAYDLVLRSANVQGESANSNVITALTAPCP